MGRWPVRVRAQGCCRPGWRQDAKAPPPPPPPPPPVSPAEAAAALAAYKIRRVRLDDDVRGVADICAEVFVHEQMFRERLAEEELRSIRNIVDGYTDRIRAETAGKLDAALEKKRAVGRCCCRASEHLREAAPAARAGRLEARACQPRSLLRPARRPRRRAGTEPTGARFLPAATRARRRPRRPSSSGFPAALPCRRRALPCPALPCAGGAADGRRRQGALPTRVLAAATGGRCSAGPRTA